MKIGFTQSPRGLILINFNEYFRIKPNVEQTYHRKQSSDPKNLSLKDERLVVEPAYPQ
jgi:hypothetical protein